MEIRAAKYRIIIWILRQIMRISNDKIALKLAQKILILKKKELKTIDKT